MYEPPVFFSSLQVRSSACWAHDFITNCDVPLVLWAPEWDSVHTTMPPSGRWDAASQMFIGRFSRRFPGRWVPVPWAYSDQVQMCRRAEDPLHSNVILETCSIQPDGCHLIGVCRTVNSRLSRESAAGMMHTTIDMISVLGIAEDAPWPALRDGDIIHQQPTSFVVDSSHTDSRRCSFFALLFGLLVSSRGHIGPAILVLLPWATGLLAPCATPVGFAAWLPWQSPGPALLPAAPGVLQGTGTISAEACYFAARGAPSWGQLGPNKWLFDLTAVCKLQVDLHSFWCSHPLSSTLPMSLPAPYHCAWEAFPQWAGGVPHEILISTDGSGSATGSCAFVVWCYYGQQWFRLGWFAAKLPHLPWGYPPACQAGGPLLSFHSELAALQSAGLWLACVVDMWRMRMGTTIRRVTLAVDNSSAMQVAAGWATAQSPMARRCREIWQAVQSRCSIRYQHVPSHVGIMVNTIVDALAEHAHSMTVPPLWSSDLPRVEEALQQYGPWLWMVHSGCHPVLAPYL